MQVFAVFEIKNPSVVKARAEEHYAPHVYVSSPQTLFVATSGQTTKEVAETLGFGEEGRSGIVVPVTSYWGRHNPNLWEWIDSRMKL